MTEIDIQMRLYYQHTSGQSISINNYTPCNWFECDMMSITKAGYMREWEIKLSRSDFKADAKKKRSWLNSVDGKWKRSNEFKHDLLKGGDVCGPCQFWYVVPENMITPEELPSFAGLFYAKEDCNWLTEIVKAPRLHKSKVSERVLNHIRSIFAYRYWNLKSKIYRESDG